VKSSPALPPTTSTDGLSAGVATALGAVHAGELEIEDDESGIVSLPFLAASTKS